MSAVESDSQVLTSQEQAIEIISQSANLWKVRILFPTPEISDQEMVERLREAKQMISRQFGTPIELLEFREVLEKRGTPQGVAALVTIGRILVGRSKPVVRLKPMETHRGDVLQDMIAELEFNYLDEFGQPITLERLKIEFTRHGVDLALCDLEAVQRAIARARERKSFVKKLEVARGKLPEVGVDAELEYSFFTHPDAAADLAEYRAGRRVKDGDIICQKTPPRNGKKKGFDVRGESIPPIRGLDFELIPGEGTKLSVDGNRLTALRDGVPIMSRATRRIYTLAGEKTVTDKINVKVKPLVELNAEDILNIVLEDSVEIKGNFREGSSISTEGEVFFEGDIESGTQVLARDNILVEGRIKGGEISSDCSVFAGNGAKNSRIIAGEDVNIKGSVENSEISGRNVKAGQIKGSHVEASRKVSIERAGNDSAGRRTTIRMGRDDYYRRKLEANRAAVETLMGNMERIREIFGPEVIERLSGANHQQLLVEFIKRLRSRGLAELEGNTIESLRKLLQSISPLKDVIVEKTEEMETLREKASDENASKPVVVVREKIQDAVDVTIHEKTETIGPTEGGSAITASPDGDIRTYSLPSLSKPRSKPKGRV